MSGLLALDATGCATPQWIYRKPGLTAAELDADKAVCRRQSPPTGVAGAIGPDDVDRAAFNRCMERRGYSVTREN